MSNDSTRRVTYSGHFTEWERIVSAEAHAIFAEKIDKISKAFFVVGERVDPELTEIFPRRLLVVELTEVGTDLPAVLDASYGAREGASTMSDGDTKIGKAFKDAAEDEMTKRDGRLGRHADEPTEPVLVCEAFANHIPGVNKDTGAESFCFFEDREEFLSAEIPLIDVRADLNAGEAKILHASP